MEKNTILIIEDDDRFRKMLSFLFIAKGFNVKTANDGLEAWQYIMENIPLLIVLDLVMPGMDGFSFYRKIKEQSRFDNIPIIILSGLSLQEVVEKIDPGDLKHYLRKPFRTADILALTADALNSKDAETVNKELFERASKVFKEDKV